jgi:hypothetical protein
MAIEDNKRPQTEEELGLLADKAYAEAMQALDNRDPETVREKFIESIKYAQQATHLRNQEDTTTHLS